MRANGFDDLKNNTGDPLLAVRAESMETIKSYTNQMKTRQLIYSIQVLKGMKTLLTTKSKELSKNQVHYTLISV